MTLMNRRALVRTGLGMCGAALAFAAKPGEAVAADQEALVLYSGQHRQTTEALVAAFTKATGIKVTVRNGESPQLAGQLLEEGERSPADLFYSETSPPIAALEAKGMLAPIEAGTLQQIPAAYSARTGTWVGSTVRCRIVAYNKKMVAPDQLPASVLDCATSAWQGRVAYVPKDGFQEQVMAIAHVKGRDAALAWLKGLKQYARAYNSNSAAMRAVEAGEIATALTNHYYWYSLAREAGADRLNSALHYVARQDVGALRTVSAAGILKTTKKAAITQRFLAFMVSEDGQRAIAGSVAEYPVRPGVASPFPLRPLEDFAGAPVTAADIGSAADAYALQREAGIA
ncbi:extracellular solute-binding protein [Limobrevibacterium gyesilva]|uniref:Extracellular solute-binding protein n=1 Tax=Limobrevibacterium gyesilva TaxID=2991712 RepID=A0AA41YHY7_9PROT|nr:extracellular solute-binding protein [Limobrevibacterium gyesilva]MCW3473199.1 extracellular solute-binding protein [Limobrevibacterium gyesilva]